MAASIPFQYCSEYTSFSTDFCTFPTSEETSSDIIVCPNYNNGAINYTATPLMSHEVSSPVSVTSSFPQNHLLLHSDSMVVPQMMEIETTAFSNLDNYRQYDDHRACIGLMVPRLSMPAQNGPLEGNSVNTKVEEAEVKVGKYSVEEKKDRILRYLKKKNQRNFNKTIKYVCRKTLADNRVRVRGRFAKNNKQPSEDELVMGTSPTTCYGQNNFFFHDYFQMKLYEEDCWLPRAMANHTHLHYS